MRWNAVVVALVASAVSLWPGLASAYDCSIGGEQVALTATMSIAHPPGGRVVVLNGSTSRSQEDAQQCGGNVRVEGWVHGDPNGAMVHQGQYIAQLGYPGSGPLMGITCSGGFFEGTTKHLFITGGGGWIPIEVRGPAVFADNQCGPTEEELCYLQGSEYYWNGFECVYAPGSPIILDTARDGYNLTSVDDGVLFDLNADGTAEMVAWTHADSDDAFLAFDRNGNGRIDDGSELFGNHFRAYADREDVKARNGFEALRFAEGPTYGRSNGDGVIDSRDEIFGRLLLWRDMNHNGISEPEELISVGAAGVASFLTEYQYKKRIDRYGNEFRQKGQVIWSDGVVGIVYDVWLKRRP